MIQYKTASAARENAQSALDALGECREAYNETIPLTQYTGGNREGRLQPRRTHGRYWVLTTLTSSMREIVANYFTGQRDLIVADYGCGEAPYKTIIDPYAKSYIHCDLPGNPRATCLLDERGLTDLSDESVNIVISSQVLEHVESPERYLTEAHRILTEKGLLVLSTHGCWKYHPDPMDLWRWTSAGLQKIIEENGFEILECRGILGPAASALQLLQDAIEGSVPARLLPAFYFIFQQTIRWADRLCSAQIRDRDACIYVVVARRLPVNNGEI